MDIHKYEKIWLAVALVFIVGLVATVTYGALGPGIKMVSDNGGTISPANVTQSERFSAQGRGVHKVGPNHYEVNVLARQFLFMPGTTQPITVPTDSKITFYYTSADVIHGFEIVGTNVNTMVIPGQVGKMTTRFEEPGEYGIICNEYCGSGHHTMEGKLNVVPKSEFNASEV
ncbi:MAG: cytochrome c oxidase subunit II [Halobacteria archaeon]|nr:cytochrome c oxidase subunit II [Halobacteria archaeon]